MNTTKKIAALSIALTLGVSFAANAANPKEDDSAYKWGRWAVLSPAAGGEPYVAPIAPDAVNNARPGEADEFDPDVLMVVDTPPVIDPPGVIPNPPGDPVPPGDPRTPPVVTPPVVVPNPSLPPPTGDPRTPPVVVAPPTVVAPPAVAPAN